jgi:phosphoethanolamine N-methyltransferase
MSAVDGELYHDRLVKTLEGIWGAGFLSPGGRDEVARLIGGADIRGAHVLDIGCGAGGIDIALVEDHGAAYVTGIDVEDGVIARARAHVAGRALTAQIGLAKVAPGPLPFPPGTFDVVFSKDSIVHIPDKRALMDEVFRVLRPGGRFIASDWLIGHDGPPSAAMAAYIAAEGLDFGMASATAYRAAMEGAGFEQIGTVSRNAWYRKTARQERARLEGAEGARIAEAVGPDFVAQNITIWTRMIRVLDAGEHCPTHLRARKPAAERARPQT